MAGQDGQTVDNVEETFETGAEGVESAPDNTGEGLQEAPTYDALAEAAREYGMDPESVIKSYGEAQKKITQTSQEYANFRKQYEWAENFQRTLEDNPGLREHITGYFEQNEASAQEENIVRQAVDPYVQQVKQLQTAVQSMQLEKDLGAIESKGLPMNEDVKASVLTEIYQSGNGDVEAAYWKVMGPEIAKRAAEKSQKETAEHMAKNQKSYVPNRGSSGAQSAPANIGSMSQKEWSDATYDAIADLWNSTE